MILKGEKQILSTFHEMDKLNDIHQNIEINPRYHLWFMPITYLKLHQRFNFFEKGDRLNHIFKHEEMNQRHYPFMHPLLIGITENFIVFGVYEDGEHLAEPKDLTWNVLRKKIKKVFHLKSVEIE